MKRSTLQTHSTLKRKTPLRISGNRRGTVSSVATIDSAPAPVLAFPKPVKTKKAKRPFGIKRKSARRIAKRTDKERVFLDWIHRQKCKGIVHVRWHVCRDAFGRPTTEVEQSHERTIANGSGMGIKEKDMSSTSMCHSLAVDWEEHKGPFKGWSKERRRVFMASLVIETNAEFEIAHPEYKEAA